MSDTLVSLGNLQRYAGRVKTEVDKAKQVTHFVGEIFGIIGCASTYVPTGCLPCDGTEYTKAQFSSLYTDYLTATTPLLETCSYAEYATAISTYGQCAKWAVDTVNLKFKVPTVKDGSYLTQALSDGELGKSCNESLPNIVGTFNNGDRRTHIDGTSGAIFKTTISGNTWSELSQYQNNTNGVGFDASRSSPVYQNNAKVQGDNVRVRYFVCVAGGSINQSMMDWSAWSSSLAGKVNLDGTNLQTGTGAGKVRTVVETYQNGASWYRVWSDGWIEQGGYHTITSSSTMNEQVTFQKQFTTDNVTVMTTTNQTTTYSSDGGSASYNGVHARAGSINRASKTSFYINCGGNDRDVIWYACGY